VPSPSPSGTPTPSPTPCPTQTPGTPSSFASAAAAGADALSPGAAGGISFAVLLVAVGAAVWCYRARRQHARHFQSAKAARAAAAAAHAAHPVFALPAAGEHRGDVAVGSPLWRPAAAAQQPPPPPRAGTGSLPLFAAPGGDGFGAAPHRSPLWKGASV
jgi:hypothetical protein